MKYSDRNSDKRDSSEKLLSAIGEIDDNLISGAVRDTKRKKNLLRWGSLAAILVLCISVGVLFTNRPDTGTEEGTYLADSSIVILDVNPSIALTVNADETIVKAEGLNADGDAILNGMDLTDVDITVAVNAIIGSMLQKGYLNDLQNAILVSVENENPEKSAALQERISSIIGTALQDGHLEGTVLSQTLNETTDLEQMAQNYDISPGKAALIQEVMTQDATLTIEKLVPLSITEIALISQSRHLASESLTQNGAASDRAYISQESAVEIACEHAGVNAGNVTGKKVEFDSEDGIMVYEIEFYVGTVEYEYDIDARTGRIVKFESEDKGPANHQGGASAQQPSVQRPSTQQPSTQPPSAQYIGEEAARQAALDNAGIAAEDVNYINAWLEYDDGYPEHYEVEFTVGSVKYEYEIDLYSGAVLKQEMENHGSHGSHHSSANSGTASPVDIDQEAAVNAALSHAGLSASQVRKLEADYDYDDGIALYEVEFEYGNYEYEYKIDATTGEILEYEIDD
ncbi:MAG: cell wall protein [Lachnospiraceae bacterium]|nr:cell wall protein [Lachnospiraceae bacterium]